MSDWDFLYEMEEQGYNEDEIQEAMSSGVAPWELDWIEKQERQAEWKELKSLRDTGTISLEEFKKLKAEMFR